MDKILKYLPFLSGFTILLGVLKLTIFFHHFHIEIISYLSLSDILIAFLNDLNSIAVVSLISIFHICLSNHIINFFGESLIHLFIIKFKKRYIIFFGASFSLMVILLVNNWVELAIWNIYLTVFLCSNLILFLFIRREKNTPDYEFRIEIVARNLVLFIQALIISSVIVLVAIMEIREAKEAGIKVTLTMKDGKIVRNDSNIYLGKVGSYHFFSREGNASIIKDADVKRIDIKSK